MSGMFMHSGRIRFLEAVASLVILMSALLPTQASAAAPDDGSVLPFPPTPTASVAGATLQDSTMTWRKEPQRLKPDAPNV